MPEIRGETEIRGQVGYVVGTPSPPPSSLNVPIPHVKIAVHPLDAAMSGWGGGGGHWPKPTNPQI